MSNKYCGISRYVYSDAAMTEELRCHMHVLAIVKYVQCLAIFVKIY